jgi:hypothetical protein
MAEHAARRSRSSMDSIASCRAALTPGSCGRFDR